MAFWLFMLAMTLLIPLTMLLFGQRFRKKPPKSINQFFGYRTEMSMKNRDTWDFAHRYIGRRWFLWGWVTLALSVVIMLPFRHRDMDTVGWAGLVLTFVQMIPLVGAIFSTERALKRTFDRFGCRREG